MAPTFSSGFGFPPLALTCGPGAGVLGVVAAVVAGGFAAAVVAAGAVTAGAGLLAAVVVLVAAVLDPPPELPQPARAMAPIMTPMLIDFLIACT